MMLSSTKLRLAVTSFAVCLAGVTASCAPSRADEHTKLFGGHVLETHPREGWFVMRGGGSQKYARVTITYDGKTRWSGIDTKNKSVKPGDPLRVTAVAAKAGSFRAVEIHKIDPHAKPVLGGMSPSP